jgi:hypothetical protein
MASALGNCTAIVGAVIRAGICGYQAFLHRKRICSNRWCNPYRHFHSQIEYVNKTQRPLAKGATDRCAPSEAASFILLARPEARKKYKQAPKNHIGKPGSGIEKGHRCSDSTERIRRFFSVKKGSHKI